MRAKRLVYCIDQGGYILAKSEGVFVSTIVSTIRCRLAHEEDPLPAPVAIAALQRSKATLLEVVVHVCSHNVARRADPVGITADSFVCNRVVPSHFLRSTALQPKKIDAGNDLRFITIWCLQTRMKCDAIALFNSFRAHARTRTAPPVQQQKPLLLPRSHSRLLARNKQLASKRSKCWACKPHLLL